MSRDKRRGERGPEWRGDDGFGGGWGNQVPRPHRLEEDRGYGGDDWFGPSAMSSDYRYGGPGLDGQFSNGPRFDQVDVGRAGGHGAWPVTSTPNLGYGMGSGGMFGGSAREHAIRHDPHYADWRHRQMAEIDRDYDEYRREHQSRFDREFADWRSRRQEQRAALRKVSEHMEVVGSDGAHVGTVDCTRGDRMILTRSDRSAGGLHHSIPCGWIEKVEDKVHLTIDAEEARKRWESENRSRALFERERDIRGPHVLNRSFAGTYSDEE